MKIGDGGLALIKAFEGCRLRAYRDPVGIWTIGYGLTSSAGIIDVHEGLSISQQQADEFLAKSLAKFEDAVKSVTTRSPNQNQFDAMCSLCFNIGPAAFAKSSVLRLFNEGQDEAAADAFLLWNKAGGKVLDGLTRRRKAERALFLREAPVITAIPKETAMQPQKFLNLNALQTYLSAALVAIPAAFLSVGCTQSATGALECAHSTLPFLTPEVTGIATGIIAVLKFGVVPAMQNGGWVRNLFSPKVPVSESGAPGTVSSVDVQPPLKG